MCGGNQNPSLQLQHADLPSSGSPHFSSQNHVSHLLHCQPFPKPIFRSHSGHVVCPSFLRNSPSSAGSTSKYFTCAPRSCSSRSGTSWSLRWPGSSGSGPRRSPDTYTGPVRASAGQWLSPRGGIITLPSLLVGGVTGLNRCEEVEHGKVLQSLSNGVRWTWLFLLRMRR